MFRLVERPTLMPARTLIGSTVGPVVDTEVILRNGGRVYLSETETAECVKFFPRVVERLATDLGWKSPAEVNDLNSRIADLEEKLAEAESGQPKVIAFEDALKLSNELRGTARPATVGSSAA